MHAVSSCWHENNQLVVPLSAVGVGTGLNAARVALNFKVWEAFVVYPLGAGMSRANMCQQLLYVLSLDHIANLPCTWHFRSLLMCSGRQAQNSVVSHTQVASISTASLQQPTPLSPPQRQAEHQAQQQAAHMTGPNGSHSMHPRTLLLGDDSPGTPTAAGPSRPLRSHRFDSPVSSPLHGLARISASATSCNIREISMRS